MSDHRRIKDAAIDKWASFASRIGGPDVRREWIGLEIGRSGHAANILAGQDTDTPCNLAKIGNPVDRNGWGMSPQTVSGQASPTPGGAEWRGHPVPRLETSPAARSAR